MFTLVAAGPSQRALFAVLGKVAGLRPCDAFGWSQNRLVRFDKEAGEVPVLATSWNVAELSWIGIEPTFWISKDTACCGGADGIPGQMRPQRTVCKCRNRITPLPVRAVTRKRGWGDNDQRHCKPMTSRAPLGSG